MLRKISTSKRGEVTADYRILQNEGLHDFSSSNNMTVIKENEMNGACSIGKTGNACMGFKGKPGEMRPH